MSRLALIDGDVIVYNAGFASDAQARQRGEEHEPLEFALHGVAEKLRAIERNAEATDSLIYISHPVNHREEFYPEYKMNRNVLHKPFWYDEIKQYLFDHKGAIYSEVGEEADDALGLHQMHSLVHDEETIICTIDKDLDMIPGLHYNFGPKRKFDGIYEMEDPECLRLFYRQMVTGDSSDNIPGLFKRKGTKAREQLMAPIDGMTRAKEMYEYVLALYGGESEADFLAVTGKLLWIKRTEDWWAAPV